ncbi:unnamed protein product [Angiostrongylus costaricensis]|uniref:C2 domain-containing protein n=1 Tax=Angiostrongylus costaricensis TaxID=334426 RepID=A0A0R3PK06_ANGCS|nr:unnamed protein product [Angiostrongylus costaricensis]
MEKAVYGGNVEDDEELLAELLALQREEEAKQRRSSPMPPSRPPASPYSKVGTSPALGVDPAKLAAALADNVEVDEHALENDEDLLVCIRNVFALSKKEYEDSITPEHLSKLPDTAMLSRLSGLLIIYEKMLSVSDKEGNTLKMRRHQRSVDKLKGLISKAQRGEDIDESEIPPAPPSLSSTSRDEKERIDSKKQRILEVLKRRRDAYVANGKAAVAAMDKGAAKQYVEIAKMFDQVEALAAMDTADADELDLSEVPPSPQPYRRVEQPTTFIGGLESRMNRMNTRMAEQYKAAILDAKAGHPVAVAELPSLPNMPPLPPQNQEPTLKTSTPSAHPPPAVGPLAASGQPGTSRNSTQLQFLIMRQNEFKQAAIHAKSKGNLELAKKYLLEAKGFDKMITAAKAGLPVSIKATPIPPQVSTSQATLQPRIVPTTSSTTGIEGRGETLSMMEKSLIEQVQLAENSRMRFTRLGDVGKVKLFEDWAKVSKQDLLLVREVAKQGLKLPKFHYESRHIPCADLFPDLAEDVLELSIIRCRDVPLPSGYEPNDANLFVKFVFPYPSDANQSGKTKYVPGTQNPESNALLEETLPLKEGRKAIGGLLTLKIRIREPLGDAKLTSTQHRWLVLDN